MLAESGMEATVAYETRAILGEGPVWDVIKEKLYWVDIVSGKLFVYDPRAGTNTTFDVGGHLGAVALREKGGLVLAKESGFAFFDLQTREVTPIADPEAHIPGNRFNDGKCDPSGRFWAGTLSYDLEEGAGNLYCLDVDLSVDQKLTGLTISNGMAWDRERTRFFLVDSGTGNLFSFDYDEPAGGISSQSVVWHSEQGSPDGMTIDTEDHLWVALYGAGKVLRIDPASGETVFEVRLPVPRPTSCTFGGQGLDELYITTARENMSDEELWETPLSGSLFKAKVPAKGFPPSRFAG